MLRPSKNDNQKRQKQAHCELNLEANQNLYDEKPNSASDKHFGKLTASIMGWCLLFLFRRYVEIV